MQSFNEDNQDHLDALDYFLFDTGHPRFILDDKVVDVDIEFRDFIVAHFNLPVSEDDCNGSIIELVSRKKDNASISTHFEWDDEDGNSFELKVKCSGKLLLEGREVVFKPDTSKIKTIIPFQITNDYSFSDDY